MADFIYGELNDAVLSIDYEGKETDTADVSVDPLARTISVDVRKVPNALTVQTQSGLVAYDGSRPVSLSVGAYEIREVGSTGNFRNYGLFQSGSDGALGVTIGVPSAKTLLSAEILQCQVADEPVLGYEVGEYYARFTCASHDSEAQDNYYVYMLLSPILQGVGDLVDSERERAEEAEQALSEAISDEASAREAGDSANSGLVAAERERAEGKEEELGSAIQAEAQRAEGREAEIESALSAETETRQSEDSAIRASVSSEISRASQAEGTLQSNLDAESRAREEADDLLREGIDEAQENIASEATAREEKDNVLQAASDANAEAIADEAEARENGDSALSSRLDTEVARAMGAETSLSTDLGTEIAERKLADAGLTGEIAKKQDLLVSGTNIKTVNGQSLLGDGDLSVQGVAPDSYTKGESDARYAQKTADVLSNGAVTSIGYDQIEPYAFVVMHGYKNNVGAPNQLTFVLVPKWLTDGESNLIVPGMATATNWNYGIVFTRNGGTVSWETDVDYGGDRQFLVTNILGVY